MRTIDHRALRALAAPCRLCELRCGVDRWAGERGVCGAGPAPRLSNAFVHLGEEPELVPCFTIFFTGCNFRCPYCSDGEWVDHPERGRAFDAEALLAQILARPQLRSVELVGGLADLHLPAAAELAAGLPAELPLVLNTNGWLSLEALALLPGWIDLLLLDVKHASEPCLGLGTGRQLPDYLGHLGRVLDAGRRTLRLGVWLRHLVLPGHLDCCTAPVLRWLARRAPGSVVNVMSQYRPLHRARSVPGLGRTLSAAERAALPGWLAGLGLELALRLDGLPLDRARG